MASQQGRVAPSDERHPSMSLVDSLGHAQVVKLSGSCLDSRMGQASYALHAHAETAHEVPRGSGLPATHDDPHCDASASEPGTSMGWQPLQSHWKGVFPPHAALPTLQISTAHGTISQGTQDACGSQAQVSSQMYPPVQTSRFVLPKHGFLRAQPGLSAAWEVDEGKQAAGSVQPGRQLLATGATPFGARPQQQDPQQAASRSGGRTTGQYDSAQPPATCNNTRRQNCTAAVLIPSLAADAANPAHSDCHEAAANGASGIMHAEEASMRLAAHAASQNPGSADGGHATAQGALLPEAAADIRSEHSENKAAWLPRTGSVMTESSNTRPTPDHAASKTDRFNGKAGTAHAYFKSQKALQGQEAAAFSKQPGLIRLSTGGDTPAWRISARDCQLASEDSTLRASAPAALLVAAESPAVGFSSATERPHDSIKPHDGSNGLISSSTAQHDRTGHLHNILHLADPTFLARIRHNPLFNDEALQDAALLKSGQEPDLQTNLDNMEVEGIGPSGEHWDAGLMEADLLPARESADSRKSGAQQGLPRFSGSGTVQPGPKRIALGMGSRTGRSLVTPMQASRRHSEPPSKRLGSAEGEHLWRSRAFASHSAVHSQRCRSTCCHPIPKTLAVGRAWHGVG